MIIAMPGAPVHAQIADARTLLQDLLAREERRTLARLPIDRELETRIMDAEIDVIHLEAQIAAGLSSRDEQAEYGPDDLDIRHAA